MGLHQELKKCYLERQGSADDVLLRYSEKLEKDEEKVLLRTTSRLFGAYCASPAFNKSRQLDILAEKDKDMRILRALIRDYGQGVENILDAYDKYFQLEDKKGFWEFFNKELNLPEDWLEKAKLETDPAYGTGLDDYSDMPDIYPDDFDYDLNKMLDEKGV